MKKKIIKFRPLPFSRFHFGQMKMDHDLSLSDTDSFCHSDTLFSGLVNCFDNISDKVDEFVEAFRQQKIVISSLFYYIEKENSETIYLLPKPAFLSKDVVKDSNHKKVKAIEFVSNKVWEQGFAMDEWTDESKYKILQGNILITAQEFINFGLSSNDKVFEKYSSPKNGDLDEAFKLYSNQPKSTTNSKIYYQTDVVLHPINNVKVGFYFIFECTEPNLELDLINATNVLAFTGIGGEIKVIGRTPMEAPAIVDSFEIRETKYFSNLSLYNPKDESEFKTCELYETSLRGGRRMTDDKTFTKVVRMVNEGALFTSTNVKGRIVELGQHETNNNKILRYGIPLLMPINYESR